MNTMKSAKINLIVSFMIDYLVYVILLFYKFEGF